jgi:hypothetical protein
MCVCPVGSCPIAIVGHDTVAGNLANRRGSRNEDLGYKHSRVSLKGALHVARRYEDKKCSLDLLRTAFTGQSPLRLRPGLTLSASSVASAVTVTDLRGNAQILEEARFTPAEIEDLGEERVVTAAV